MLRNYALDVCSIEPWLVPGWLPNRPPEPHSLEVHRYTVGVGERNLMAGSPHLR